MKLATFLTVSGTVDAAGKWMGDRPEVSKEEASQFLERDARANSVPGADDDSLMEELRTGNLERECNEETCDWAEAFEIFEDKDKTDEFMYTRLHQCELKNPCLAKGTASCVNKWDNYWCQCLSGWYGKDCDFMDTKDGYMCQRSGGCANAIPNMAPSVVASSLTKEAPTTTASSTISTTTTKNIKPYVPQVDCDTLNDRFTIRMPVDANGDLALGIDMMTADCGYTSEDSSGLIYSYGFTECGTRMRIDNGNVSNFIYENHLSRKPAFVSGVYRDYGAIYNIRCVIDRYGHVDNNLVNSTTGEIIGDILPVYIVPDSMIKAIGDVENEDRFIFRLNIYENENYIRKYTMPEFPLTASLKESIYLGTELLTSMDHQYIFTKRCWATPVVDTNTQNDIFSPIIDNGCPTDQFTALQPRFNREDRFATKTLRFPNSNYVYIQCDLIVCDLRVPNDPACQSTCRMDEPTFTKASEDVIRRRRRAADSMHPAQIVTLGPLLIFDEVIPVGGTSWFAVGGWVVACCAMTSMAAFYVQKKRAGGKIDPTVM